MDWLVQTGAAGPLGRGGGRPRLLLRTELHRLAVNLRLGTLGRGMDLARETVAHPHAKYFAAHRLCFQPLRAAALLFSKVPAACANSPFSSSSSLCCFGCGFAAPCLRGPHYLAGGALVTTEAAGTTAVPASTVAVFLSSDFLSAAASRAFCTSAGTLAIFQFVQ